MGDPRWLLNSEDSTELLAVQGLVERAEEYVVEGLCDALAVKIINRLSEAFDGE